MEYQEAWQQLQAGKIFSVYLLYGEETYLSHSFEQAVIEKLLPPEQRTLNLTVFDSDPDFRELSLAVQTTPFFGDQSVVIVHNSLVFRGGKAAEDDKDTGRSLGEMLGKLPAHSCLIFAAGEEVDKRRRIFKTIDKYGAAVEFSALKTRDIRPWLQVKLQQLHKRMAPAAIQQVISAVSVMPRISLGFLDNELTKLALYTGDREVITAQDLAAAFSAVTEISTFVIIDAIAGKDVNKALRLLNEQLVQGEQPLRLLALLARQVRQLLQTREMVSRGFDGGQIAKALEIPLFVGKKLTEQSRKFSPAILEQAIINLARADRDLKSARSDSAVLEKIVIEMCS